MRLILDIILLAFLCWLIQPYGTCLAIILWLVIAWRTWVRESGWREALWHPACILVTFALVTVLLFQVVPLVVGLRAV